MLYRYRVRPLAKFGEPQYVDHYRQDLTPSGPVVGIVIALSEGVQQGHIKPRRITFIFVGESFFHSSRLLEWVPQFWCLLGGNVLQNRCHSFTRGLYVAPLGSLLCCLELVLSVAVIGAMLFCSRNEFRKSLVLDGASSSTSSLEPLESLSAGWYKLARFSVGSVPELLPSWVYNRLLYGSGGKGYLPLCSSTLALFFSLISLYSTQPYSTLFVPPIVNDNGNTGVIN